MVDSSDRERIEESKTAFGKIGLQFWWNSLATHYYLNSFGLSGTGDAETSS